jgi:hypothetical protein
LYYYDADVYLLFDHLSINKKKIHQLAEVSSGFSWIPSF